MFYNCWCKSSQVHHLPDPEQSKEQPTAMYSSKCTMNSRSSHISTTLPSEKSETMEYSNILNREDIPPGPVCYYAILFLVVQLGHYNRFLTSRNSVIHILMRHDKTTCGIPWFCNLAH